MGKIREPIKKNSIAKKKKIIAEGFKLICDKGYHNVSCVDIAKYCSVSTGIIYQYFEDKRAIFIEGVKLYSDKIMFPLLKTIENKKINDNDLVDVIKDLIKKMIKQKKTMKKAHQELLSMSCLDKEVLNIYSDKEIVVTNKFVVFLLNNGFNLINLNEKVHLIVNLIDNLCNETIYHRHRDINYDIFMEETVNLIIFLLKENNN